MTLLVAWLGRVTGKIIPDKTYDVSSKTLNSTKPMPVTLLPAAIAKAGSTESATSGRRG